MTFTRRFWFEGLGFIGQAPAEVRFHRGQLDPPLSYAFFCPTCGDVWAKAIVQDDEGKQRPFMVWTISCERHDPGWRLMPAGSLWLDWEKEFNESLPPAVIERELQVHLRFAESRNDSSTYG